MPEESYCSYDEARQIIAALNICTAGQYRSRYKEHAGLPSNPPIFFAGKGWDCWYVFLSKAKPDLYESLSQAQIAARFLGISTQLEYVARYKEDSRLPSDPVRFYDECKSWRHFFQEDYEKAYPTYEEAKSAARRLGVHTAKEYKNRYLGMLRSTCRAAAASCNFPGTYSVIGR
ncbi:integrase repeat-containing protein, partial [Pseudomonas monteilii]|uniref:integrase repeat-containing protein n=4 Tax=Pseudomonas TaxID=286 RepID=UPI001E4ED685